VRWIATGGGRSWGSTGDWHASWRRTAGAAAVGCGGKSQGAKRELSGAEWLGERLLKCCDAPQPQHSRSGECHSSHTHRNAQAHQTGFRCWGCGGDTLAGGLFLGIRLRFHNHAPQQLAIGLALHHQAADELGSDELGGAGEEGWREVLGRRGGYGSGLGDEWRLLALVSHPVSSICLT